MNGTRYSAGKDAARPAQGAGRQYVEIMMTKYFEFDDDRGDRHAILASQYHKLKAEFSDEVILAAARQAAFAAQKRELEHGVPSRPPNPEMMMARCQKEQERRAEKERFEQFKRERDARDREREREAHEQEEAARKRRAPFVQLLGSLQLPRRSPEAPHRDIET